MTIISPSILAADLLTLDKEIEQLSKAGADMLHLDIMDGHFVPNLTFGPPLIKQIKKKFPNLPLDVHLMITNAETVIDDYINAGSDYISVHLEANTHIHRTISKIQDNGLKAGVAINPSTPISLLDNILYLTDFILIMSVNPGFSFQKFIEPTFNKISSLKRKIDENGFKAQIAVDGGVTTENSSTLISNGAEILVSGKTIFASNDYAEVIKSLKSP